MPTTIALIGLSGSGKTTVGQLLAQAIGWQYLDTDQLIEQTTQRTIADIFAHEGEVTFRQLEAQALQAALQQPSTVIATGGGIVEAAANRELLRHKAFIVWLHAPTNALVSRLSTADDRPLLAGDAALALERMATRRTAFYAELAHWNVATQHLTPTQATDEIIRAWTLLGTSHNEQELYVTTPGGSYAVRAGSGVLAELPGWLDRLQIRGRAWLISDTAVLSAHGEHVITALRKHGREVQSYAFPNGEQHKTLETVRLVYDWLLASGVERGDVVLALGGGVVGDLAGFVAATVLRGIALVQLPTTVLAMVDSAIGGKTGVDHAVGKNLIGAFHQPRLVLADTSVLPTLSPNERAAGWAEAIKHGVIGDPALFADLARYAQDVLELREPRTGELIRRAAAHKVRVVSGDEREQGGRIMLNYGHTIGHAVEAESGYTLRHGEAVAIGMMAAGSIAQRLGLFEAAELDEQRRVLQAFGLPTTIPATMNVDNIVRRISSDKKVRASRVRWVLPTGIGNTVVRDDVPQELVVKVVQELCAPEDSAHH